MRRTLSLEERVRRHRGYKGKCQECGQEDELRFVPIGFGPGSHKMACKNCMRDHNNFKRFHVTVEEVREALCEMGTACFLCEDDDKDVTPLVTEGKIHCFLCMSCKQTVGKVRRLERLERLVEIMSYIL